jgi:hypothetical protein
MLPFTRFQVCYRQWKMRFANPKEYALSDHGLTFCNPFAVSTLLERVYDSTDVLFVASPIGKGLFVNVVHGSSNSAQMQWAASHWGEELASTDRR